MSGDERKLLGEIGPIGQARAALDIAALACSLVREPSGDLSGLQRDFEPDHTGVLAALANLSALLAKMVAALANDRANGGRCSAQDVLELIRADHEVRAARLEMAELDDEGPSGA